MHEEYKKAITNVIQLLMNQGYTLQEICNILKFNDLNILLEIVEIELKNEYRKNNFIKNQLFLSFCNFYT